MPVGMILFGLALLVLTIPIVASPLRHAASQSAPAARLGISDTPATHSQVLLAIRDLDFDNRTGKVAPEDYSRLRAALMTEAASAIQREDTAEQELSSEIETAVRSLRSPRTVASNCDQCGAALESTDRFCATCGQSTMRPCPNCGAEAFPADRFCSACGVTLPSHVPQPDQDDRR